MKITWKKAPFVLVMLMSSIMVLLVSSCVESSRTINTFEELLTLIPDTVKDDGGIVLIDYQRIWQENEISLVSDNLILPPEHFLNQLQTLADEKPLAGINAIALGSYYTGWGQFMISLPMNDDTIGYDYTDVRAEISNLGVRPSTEFGPLEQFTSEPELRVAALGNYDPTMTMNALKNRTSWPDWVINNYTVEVYHDTSIHSWGDVDEQPFGSSFNPPHLDAAGKAYPLAVSDDHLFIGSSVSHLKEMIDSNQNKRRSLANIEEYAQAARNMYELKAFGAIIVDESLVNGYPQDLEYNSLPLLNNFLLCGTGTGRDTKGNFIALVLVHENNTVASQNVDQLKTRIQGSWTEWDGSQMSWSDLIYDFDIHVDDNVLLAKLYTDDETLWKKWFYNRWPLVLHE